MKNKKISIGIGVVIIVIVAITVCIFVWKCKNNESLQVDQLISTQSKNFEISNKWTVISNYNFWRNPSVFTRSPYNFPNIEFSYPDNWEFRCCGDMDHASEHFISPFKNIDKSLPYIRITNMGLDGCPDLKNNCAMDETVKLTANEKFKRLILAIPSDQILPKIKLEKLNTEAFVYQKTEKDSRISKAYIINLGDSIVEIDFINYDLLNEKFIENFLNRIELESK